MFSNNLETSSQHDKSFETNSGNVKVEPGLKKIMVEIQNVRRLLENARQLYNEGGIKFGIAKCWLVEAEFILDLFYDRKLQLKTHLEQSYLGIQDPLDEAKKIFEELGYIGLTALVLK